MTRRNYQQQCPLAFSLDLIGERWTLLIIRDLLLGPLRFTDILERLPGMGRNLLTERLRRLQELDLVERRQLDPPAASTVYELTPLGRGLETPILAFSGWGLGYLQARGQPMDGHFEPELLAFALKMRFDPTAAASDRDLVDELTIEGRKMRLSLRAGQLRVRRGGAEDASLRVIVPASVLLEAVQLPAFDLSAAAARGDIQVTGGPAELSRFAASYRFAPIKAE